MTKLICLHIQALQCVLCISFYLNFIVTSLHFCYYYSVNATRQQQILSLIKRIISTELRELNHELFHSVVVTNVLLSNDGRECRIWVDADAKSIHMLNTIHHRELQYRFTKKFVRKIVPKLIFVEDSGEIERMETLLNSIK